MHRMSALILSAVLALPVSTVCAEEAPADKPSSTPPAIADVSKQSAMPMMEMHGKGMHAMGMRPKMGAKNMVATSDGGVVIMVGGKIIKYDKDLNLVKEVEFKELSEQHP